MRVTRSVSTVNWAVIVTLLLIVVVHGPVTPLHPPPFQPTKVWPGSGVAVSVTVVPFT